MRIFCAAAILALLAGPAFAQQAAVPRYGEVAKPKTPQEIEAEKAADQAYQKSLGNIPDQGPVDPWGSARSTDAPKSAAKAASKSAAKTAPAKPTKTGSTAN
jgi:hypothetical protein